MTVTKQIVVGVTVILLSGLLMGTAEVYGDIRANTQHREESNIKIERILDTVTRMEERQKLLMDEYKKGR